MQARSRSITCCGQIRDPSGLLFSFGSEKWFLYNLLILVSWRHHSKTAVVYPYWGFLWLLEGRGYIHVQLWHHQSIVQTSRNNSAPKLDTVQNICVKRRTEQTQMESHLAIFFFFREHRRAHSFPIAQVPAGTVKHSPSLSQVVLILLNSPFLFPASVSARS